MRISPAVLALSALLLGACQTSVLEVEDKEVPATTSSFTGTQSVAIDKSQSYVSFVGKSNIINHEGAFDTYDVTLTLDTEEPANLEKASITATIDIASVRTDAEGLTGHLQKEDFFDVAQYPTATFTSTSIVSKGNDSYDVMGNLTVKGVTKQVTINATIVEDYILARFDMQRTDFGVGNDSYGNKLLEPAVPVEAKLVFQR